MFLAPGGPGRPVRYYRPGHLFKGGIPGENRFTYPAATLRILYFQPLVAPGGLLEIIARGIYLRRQSGRQPLKIFIRGIIPRVRIDLLTWLKDLEFYIFSPRWPRAACLELLPGAFI
jgi:hypothetical protein